MGVENNCCCCSLQRGSKIIAILDIFVAFLTLLMFLFFDKLTQFMERYLSDLDPAYVDNIENGPDKDQTILEVLIGKTFFQDDGSNGINPVVYIVLALIWSTCDIGISVLLIHGSNNRNKRSCKYWFRLRAIFLIGYLVYFFVCMSKSSLFLYGITDVLKIFYRIYCLSTVDSFIRQLERERSRSIGIPHVQVVTPDGSYADLFPNRDNFQDFYPNSDLSPRLHQGTHYTRLN